MSQSILKIDLIFVLISATGDYFMQKNLSISKIIKSI